MNETNQPTIYQAIGDCGTGDGNLIIGTYSEEKWKITTIYILTDTKGQKYSVNPDTLVKIQ